jgi:hypothetical protein
MLAAGGGFVQPYLIGGRRAFVAIGGGLRCRGSLKLLP